MNRSLVVPMLGILVLFVAVASSGAAVPPPEVKLTASDASVGDHFGSAVALEGDRALVGAAHGNSGVYVFERHAVGAWAEVQKVPSDSPFFTHFGSTVSLDGDQFIVGASFDDAFGNQFGSAFVVARDAGGTWAVAQKLVASDLIVADQFGSSVAIDGKWAMAGARTRFRRDRGAVYVFERDAIGTWVQAQKLTPSDHADGHRFSGESQSIVLAGNRAVIGSPGAAGNAGAAYVFERNALGTWLEVQKITGSDTAADDRFGYSISMDGDRLLIGARLHTGTAFRTGASYVFERNASGTWVEVQKLTANDGQANDRFGESVAINHDRAVIGAFGDSDRGTDAGAIYVFERDGSGLWRQVEKFTATDGRAEDHFYRVALSGDFALVGAEWDDDAGDKSGSAYIYDFRNRLPTADAGTNQTLECAGPSGAAVSLNGLLSSDPDDDPLTFTWMEGEELLGEEGMIQVDLPLGTHDVSLTVMDALGLADTDDVVITVRDTIAPVFSGVVGQIEVGQESDAGVPASSIDFSGVMATDLCDGAVPVTDDAPAIFPLGDTVVTFTAMDSSGNAATATTVVTVIDAAAIIDRCVGLVEALVGNGTLNRGEGNALLRPLQDAQRFLGRDQITAAISQLNAYINTVNDYIDAQKLTREQGQPLIDCARAAIEQALTGG